MNSGACYEEATEAEARGMPVVLLKHDSRGWEECMATEKFATRAENYRRMFSSEATAIHEVPGEGADFMADFWGNLGMVIAAVKPHLPPGQRLPVVAICALEDQIWTEVLCKQLSVDAVDALVCTTDEQWAAANAGPKDAGPRAVLPVLSEAFYHSQQCFDMMKAAHYDPEPRLGVLPILKDHVGNQRCSMGYKHKQDLGLAERVPFLNSILNRANRIPACTDWDRLPDQNLKLMAGAIKAICTSDRCLAACFFRARRSYCRCVNRSDEKLTEARIPK